LALEVEVEPGRSVAAGLAVGEQLDGSFPVAVRVGVALDEVVGDAAQPVLVSHESFSIALYAGQVSSWWTVRK
jgi:hypothetical protein